MPKTANVACPVPHVASKLSPFLGLVAAKRRRGTCGQPRRNPAGFAVVPFHQLQQMNDKPSADTLRDLHALTDTLLGTLGRTIESAYTMDADDDEGRAIKAWTIFSVVMILDFADAALVLSRAEKLRGILPILRSIYEYYITLAYFERHRSLAVAQLQTVDGRRLMRASAGPYINEQERTELAARAAAWRETAKAAGLDEYSGNRSFVCMAYEVEGETPELHPTYAVRYGIPSMFTHPDGAAIPDVLRPQASGGIFVVWHSDTMDPRLHATLLNDMLINTMMLLRNRFNAFCTNYEEISARHHELNARVLIAKGYDVKDPDLQG